mmetsp:Transcript_1464/g.2217  ORF Transcript_1464/g.2217 Transcript_1464/m.2217 type:complete len:176 (-) Transcript_1464:28-555(-)
MVSTYRARAWSSIWVWGVIVVSISNREAAGDEAMVPVDAERPVAVADVAPSTAGAIFGSDPVSSDVPEIIDKSIWKDDSWLPTSKVKLALGVLVWSLDAAFSCTPLSACQVLSCVVREKGVDKDSIDERALEGLVDLTEIPVSIMLQDMHGIFINFKQCRCIVFRKSLGRLETDD